MGPGLLLHRALRLVVLMLMLMLQVGMVAMAEGEEGHCEKPGDEGCKKAEPKAEKGKDPEPLRVILVGKTGGGKSSTGNTILGQEKFKVSSMSKSHTRKPQLERATVLDNRTVEVLDGPGLFDTTMSHTHITLEIIRSLGALSPGPHAFLYVIPVGRFTQEDFETYKLFKKMFENITEHVVIIFSHSDNLKADGIKKRDFIKNSNDDLKTVLRDCKKRFVFFNNRSKNKRQIQALFKRVEEIGKGPFWEKHLSPLSDEVMREIMFRANKEVVRYHGDGRYEFSFEDKRLVTTGQLDKYIDYNSKPLKSMWGFVKWVTGAKD